MLFFYGDPMNWNADKNSEFEGLLLHYTSLIRAHIYKHQIGKFGLDVEDILQEARIKLWKLLKNEKKVANYASYIRKIVDTSVIDFFRKFKREEGVYLHEKYRNIAETIAGYDKGILYADMDLKDIVGEAVKKLIPSRQQVVRLYLLNMSINEISLYLKCSPSKTRNLLYRGLKDLKIIILENPIDYKYLP
jgi:RNA polymerase sigma-70 factor (ECF subfamily)